MRLQDVLRQRDEEIAALERSVKMHDEERMNGNGHTNGGMLSPPASESEGDGLITPITVKRFENLRNSMQLHTRSESNSVSNPDTDEQLERLNDLMRCGNLRFFEIEIRLTLL